MPDKRKHRGAHSADKQLFSDQSQSNMRLAVDHLTWLFSHGYARKSSLALVGDHFRLKERQRRAVLRISCSDQQLKLRRKSQLALKDLKGKTLLVDGYNVLTTVESALGKGVILASRDGCYRDMASMHGNYRKVSETVPSILAIGKLLESAELSAIIWYLDKPVSNSGRLKALLELLAGQNKWPREVKLVKDPDRILNQAEDPIATADSAILEICQGWFNLARAVVDKHMPQAWVVDLTRT